MEEAEGQWPGAVESHRTRTAISALKSAEFADVHLRMPVLHLSVP